MGNHLPQQQETLDTSGYVEEAHIENSRYGDITIWKAKDSLKKIAISVNIIHDEEVYTKGLMAQNRLLELKHDSIVSLLKLDNKKQEEFCSSFWHLNLLYEYLDYDLQQDVYERLQNQFIHYDESELWHILVSVIASLAYLKSNGFDHHDIRPQSILINYEGRVKILPKPYFSKSTNSFFEVITGNYSQKNIYLSPAQLNNLKLKNPKATFTISKTDIFTLAVSVIECALLKNFNGLYDLKNYTLAQDQLTVALQEVSQKYSQTLVEFLKVMLIIEENEKPDADKLYSQIEQLCKHQNVQVADRLFSLQMRKDSLSPQKLQIHDEVPQTTNPIVNKIEPISHSPLQKTAPVQENIELNYDYPTVAKNWEIVVNNDHHKEKVKRSNNFKDDHKIIQSSQQQLPSNYPGYDPRYDKNFNLTTNGQHLNQIIEEERIKRSLYNAPQLYVDPQITPSIKISPQRQVSPARVSQVPRYDNDQDLNDLIRKYSSPQTYQNIQIIQPLQQQQYVTPQQQQQYVLPQQQQQQYVPLQYNPLTSQQVQPIISRPSVPYNLDSTNIDDLLKKYGSGTVSPIKQSIYPLNPQMTGSIINNNPNQSSNNKVVYTQTVKIVPNQQNQIPANNTQQQLIRKSSQQYLQPQNNNIGQIQTGDTRQSVVQRIPIQNSKIVGQVGQVGQIQNPNMQSVRLYQQ